MKQLKRVIVLAVLTLVMTLAPHTDVEAALVNTPGNLEWGKGYSVEFENSYGDDLVYQQHMNLQTSGRVNIALEASSGDWLSIHVYDSSEAEIYGKSLSTGLANYSFNLLAGDYVLEIRKATYTYERSLSFVPTFTPSGETVSESYMFRNNQVGTASDYWIGNSVKAHFAVNDDVDIYKVNITKAGNLDVKFYSEIARLDMTVTCPDKDIEYRQGDIPIGSSKYTYFVPSGTYYIAFYKDGYNGTYTFSTELKGITTSKVSSVKNLKGKKAKVTWAKKADVDGYQVQVATNKKFTKNKKSKVLAGKNVKTYTFTKLKKGKTYYARVRTYKQGENGTKYYSAWSAAKKVKISK